MYILDEDPKKSARYLIGKHVILYLKAIEHTLALYLVPEYEPVNKLGMEIPQIMYSKENYLWFSRFYDELLLIKPKYVSSNPSFKNEFLYDINREFENEGLKLPSALEFSRLLYKINEYKKYVVGIENPVYINRIMYILNNYNTKLFVGPTPSWYTPISTQLYVGHDKKARKNIKIEVDPEGNYHYYMSTISDKWNEIIDVPNDVKYVINSLLYY